MPRDSDPITTNMTDGYCPPDCDPLVSESPMVAISETGDRDLTAPLRFFNRYEDAMVVNADPDVYRRYLDAHDEWFERCARPMVAEPMGDNSYAITIGRFGASGYQVEPKVGFRLLPEDHSVYRIETVPVPGYEPQGYDVDFQATMLVSPDEGAAAQGTEDASALATRITWTLDLTVFVRFPKFIRVIPDSVLQSTGDRLLGQIVRQVSKRLNRKVILDFHESQGLPLPKRSKWL